MALSNEHRQQCCGLVYEWGNRKKNIAPRRWGEGMAIKSINSTHRQFRDRWSLFQCGKRAHRLILRNCIFRWRSAARLTVWLGFRSTWIAEMGHHKVWESGNIFLLELESVFFLMIILSFHSLMRCMHDTQMPKNQNECLDFNDRTNELRRYGWRRLIKAYITFAYMAFAHPYGCRRYHPVSSRHALLYISENFAIITFIHLLSSVNVFAEMAASKQISDFSLVLLTICAIRYLRTPSDFQFWQNM